MTWKRARSEEKKTERKIAIYDAAVSLFRSRGYEKVSLNGIASEAGFAVSNIYRYFSSREEIFLNIFSDSFISWSDDCLLALRTLEPGTSVHDFARTWVKTIHSHKDLLDLSPLLMISLERNSSYEQLLEFKKLTMRVFAEHSEAMCRIFPDLSPEYISDFLILSNAALTNLWLSASHNQTLEKVYNRPEFENLKPDFERDLIKAIEIIIFGIKAKEKENV